MKRDASAIRLEVIESAKNFMGERLDVEQTNMAAAMKDFLLADSLSTFLNAGKLNI
jgi:hypothetical protein